VGIDHDTAAFAANAIRSWWKLVGRERYPGARGLLITADGGGNGSRVRLWKIELQKLADELGVPITVCHLPPGTTNGTRWSIASSRSSPETGAANLNAQGLGQCGGIANPHEGDLRHCSWPGEAGVNAIRRKLLHRLSDRMRDLAAKPACCGEFNESCHR